MKKNKKLIVTVVLITLLASCKFLDSKDYLIANSAWFMDKKESNEADIKYLFTDNILIFNEESTSVPYLQTQFEKGVNIGTWQVDEENRTITINCKNPYFNRTFNYCFEIYKKDKVVELYLTSDSIRILAHSPDKLESGFLKPPIVCVD